MAPRREKGRGKRETPEERQLRKWSAFTTSSEPTLLSVADRETFFQAAHELVYIDDSIRQCVIHALASGAGLQRIAQLVTGDDLAEVLQSTVIPFLNVIGHPKVLGSGLVEPYLEEVYDALFGPDGKCAVRLFRAIAANTACELDDLEVALGVLARLLDERQVSEAARESFKSIVSAIEEAVRSAKEGDSGDKLIHINALKWIERCKIALGMNVVNDSLEDVTTSFRKLRIDGPGELSSSNGPRHDNDFADIRKIRIFPTFSEIFARLPYLPVLDPSKLHLTGVDGLLDRHFRLYREDSIGEIRDAIQFHLDRNMHLLMRAKNGTDRGVRMNVYPGLVLRRLRCDRFEGLTITVSIDQPMEIRPLYPKQRSDWWQSKNRLQKDALICLLDQAGRQAIFCTVVEIRGQRFDGKATKGSAQGAAKLKNFPLPWQDMGSDSRQAILSVTPVDERDATIVADYFSGNRSPQKMVMFEFPEVLTQSFQPTLAALQSMIGTKKLPFANLLALEDVYASSTTASLEPPTYSQQRGFKFDLRSLMSNDKELTLSPKEPFDSHELIDGSTLDEKQAEALVHALTRRLALCQGPPGTGKSFTSVALLRVLLETRKLADLGPILIVTFTNHALDQTLENCLDKGIRNIIRMGTRSKSDRMEDLNIRNVSARMDRTPLEKSESRTQEDALKEATALVNNTANNLHASKQDFLDALEIFRKTKAKYDAARREVDLRCVADADIVGMTTSGLAKHLDMLKWIGVKVVLVEEAGEVLEAHTLTALLPSVEHAILIGDHLQLKPSVKKYELSSESSHGKLYSLDMSMFERLVNPPKNMPGIKLPCSTLEIQRRMRPTISTFVRQTLYPNLQDDPSVHSYPNVAGMKDSVYWLDHPFLEAGMEGTSKSNDFEVRLTTSLVAHLMSQGVYEPKDIAVITPYLGQLFKLRDSLSEVFEVALDDRDRDLLEKAGMFDSQSCANNTGKRVEKTSLLQALKVATVDNFQGEEAKVVIISLVRSNKQGNCGFLKSSNRINVLLSRARHGMYVIGNSKTSAGVPMWANVLRIFNEQGNIGTTLKLSCSRHPHATMEVSKPEDFQHLSPEGGCKLPCGRALRCGHDCEQICHSQLRHDNIFCNEPCARVKEGCDHACQNYCGDACDVRCEEPLKGYNLALPCGHVRADVRCWETQASAAIMCTVPVRKKGLRCGHMVQVHCSEVIDADLYKCETKCGGVLECGHGCMTPCYQCPDWDGVRMHAPCEVCNR
ncbi:P-loop containing nucleoside triphosphate hydrolase protein [Massarina eburnea CBS 473.64]|uniref:P-loop containing nucleoside triphosphate hydrolase protein n=1 Tax=Massarina eburnea CBS 473.64 TaxID=1395130 RepID=A0A6A6S3T0_9PLEO|nr:P-loop containing nucleoside triphosphate hydrolase protein [Massarina eburnea CBS 473.64]